MDSQVIKMQEEWRGTRGGLYYYVREKNVLIHVSEYALSKREIARSRRGPTIEYEVPVNRIKGKPIYIMSFTNSGTFLPSVCQIDAFLVSNYPGRPDWSHVNSLDPHDLRGLEIKTKDPLVKQTLKDIRAIYSLMIDDIKRYQERLDFQIIFSGARRTEDMFKDWKIGILECLCLPPDPEENRLASLEVPLKWIYQLWITKLVCEAMSATDIIREEWENKSHWWIEQGSPRPAFTFRSPYGLFSVWFEFQPSIMAHLFGPWITRTPIRPDIVVAKGRFKAAEELKKIDLIIECKNEDFHSWERDVYEQIIPYFRKYRPHKMILASMKSVPGNVKQELEEIGIIVIDKLSPLNESTINVFKEICRKNLLSNPVK